MTNVVILGCGRIAATMALTLRMMRENGEDVCLYAAAARDLARAQEFCAKEGFEKAYGSYEEMLRDDNVDLVYIATPHSHHGEQIKLCADYGRAVLCEKSFTANAAQAREALDYAKAKGVLVTEAIWTRYMPSKQIILDLIKNEIGAPKLIMSNLHYDIEDKPRIVDPNLAGGALLDVGVYPLNFACMFFGSDPVRMESTVQLMETGVDRSESFTLYYADGRVAQLSAGTVCRSDRSCLIAGKDGYISVDNVNNPNRVTLYKASENHAIAHDIPLPRQLTGYEYQVRACMKALAEGALECPDMPHAETIRVMELMDALRAQWGVRYPFE